jgi:hypothetical protein
MFSATNHDCKRNKGEGGGFEPQSAENYPLGQREQDSPSDVFNRSSEQKDCLLSTSAIITMSMHLLSTGLKNRFIIEHEDNYHYYSCF